MACTLSQCSTVTGSSPQSLQNCCFNSYMPKSFGAGTQPGSLNRLGSGYSMPAGQVCVTGPNGSCTSVGKVQSQNIPPSRGIATTTTSSKTTYKSAVNAYTNFLNNVSSKEDATVSINIVDEQSIVIENNIDVNIHIAGTFGWIRNSNIYVSAISMNSDFTFNFGVGATNVGTRTVQTAAQSSKTTSTQAGSTMNTLGYYGTVHTKDVSSVSMWFSNILGKQWKYVVSAIGVLFVISIFLWLWWCSERSLCKPFLCPPFKIRGELGTIENTFARQYTKCAEKYIRRKNVGIYDADTYRGYMSMLEEKFRREYPETLNANQALKSLQAELT